MREPPRTQPPRAPIDPSEFVACVQPLLEGRDVQALAAVLKDRYTGEQITSLLQCAHADARKVAALAIGLVGTTCCLHKIASLLKDPDPMVNQLAEHAMWSIWFRSGRTPEANKSLCRGTRALNARDFT